MKKLVVIDAFAILHRAYHALPVLTSKDGIATNAAYGFFSMFLKIVNDLNPDFVAVCFDRPKPTFRKELYVGYQANRPAMESDLSSQVELVHKALEKAKIKIFEIDGYEADDLIGTISKQAVKGKDETHVIIVSGDRDLLQLVNSHVVMIAPVVGLTKMILFDIKKVEEKYGLKPDQFIDYKALTGDASDNYPGVTGVGPKTAANLLNKFGTFENIYKSLKDIPENLALKLAQDAEQAALAKKLATVVTDAPVKIKIDECKTDKIDKKELLEFFQKLGFRSLIDRVEGVKQNKKEEKKNPPPIEVQKDKKESEQMGLL